MTSAVYDTIGRGYVAHRRPDPRWARVLTEHLGVDADGLVVNVGAGTGSYEPTHCAVVALAILTVHHWDDAAAGLSELCRIAPRRVVLAIDFERHARFWLLEEYLPEVADHTRRCGPGSDEIAAAIGATTSVPLFVPRDMRDGVLGGYWCRPDAYLDAGVRANCSGLALADPAVVRRGIGRLEADLASGAWRRRHGDLDQLEQADLGYRLLVADER